MDKFHRLFFIIIIILYLSIIIHYEYNQNAAPKIVPPGANRFSGEYELFSNVAISVIYSSFFFITFDWKGNFEFWWFHRKDLVQIYQNIPYFTLKKYFFNYKNQFLRKIWIFSGFFFQFFFQITSKVHRFSKFCWLYQKNLFKIYPTCVSFHPKKI